MYLKTTDPALQPGICFLYSALWFNTISYFMVIESGRAVSTAMITIKT